MAYFDHFNHADDIILHLNSVIPNVLDQLLVIKYAGFVAVSAVTVYELAIKEIFCDFARRKHKVLGKFTESHFERINGRVSLDNIRKDYCVRFGDSYLDRFKKNLDVSAKFYMKTYRRDLKNSYSNLILWRNSFAHEGKIPMTTTYSEVVQAYEDGKVVIHVLAKSMKR